MGTGRSPIEHHSRIERHGACPDADPRLASRAGRRFRASRPFRRLHADLQLVTLRYAAATQHPWLQAIVLADQRRGAEVAGDRARASQRDGARMGDLQAQMMRLDGLGERLAKIAGLKPQELQSLQLGRRLRAAARSRRFRRATSPSAILGTPVEARAPGRRALRPAGRPRSTPRPELGQSQVPADARPDRRWAGIRRTSATASTRSPAPSRFTKGSISPPAREPRSSPPQAQVVYAGYQAEYGKIIEIDHGNGFLSRYAHASQIYVNEGDLVVRGQRLGSVGSTGRSTGPHLHFEVRLNGVPQNPARFLEAPS